MACLGMDLELIVDPGVKATTRFIAMALRKLARELALSPAFSQAVVEIRRKGLG
eukprot:CAMPEP_0171756576 /NCGR_PEP_ID=MMETSP0991-20121206/45161_1 /TAXON_ID=483369 /ORGANISM="non described non described, Strain CCMP2098" /LENGTH=53 /DNA_ID=CAMNT_0012358911 /DNA_START=236 /DNA_END=394 /DNA_ORIENTATION=+